MKTKLLVVLLVLSGLSLIINDTYGCYSPPPPPPPLPAYCPVYPPILSSPANGATCQDFSNGVVLQWGSVPCNSYAVYLDDVLIGSPTTNSCSTGSLTPGKTYSWYVETITNYGTSEQSPTWTFTAIPGQASCIYPEDNSNGTDTSVTLEWTAGDCAVSHNVYFGTSCDNLVLQESTTDTSFTIPLQLTLNTDYYWRINEVDNQANEAQGTCWHFTTIGKAIPSPFIGATAADFVSITTDISWIAGTGATSHDVYFGTDTPPENDRSSIEFKGNQTDTTFDTGTMSGDTTYYCRVNEIDAQGGTVIGDVWTFTTYPNPPGKAVCATPSDGTPGVSLDQGLSWTAGSGTTPTSYDVYFGTVNPPPLKVNTAVTTYDTGTMTAGMTYYWRIDEKNDGGTTTGDVWSFSTIPASPGQATSPSPFSGVMDVAIKKDLSWTAGSNATSHDVYFGTANPPPLVSSGQTDTTFDTGTMANSTTYYWRIDEKNAGGTTTGNVWSFTTNPASIDPDLVLWLECDEGKSAQRRGTDIIACDSTGANDGNVYGATWTTGMIDGDGALSFDGISDYVDCGSGPSNLDNITVCVWMKTSTLGTLVSNRDSSGGYGTWFTLFSNIIEIGDNSNGGAQYQTFNKNTLDGAWHHVVYTKDGTDHAVYVDGALDQSFTSDAVIGQDSPMFIGLRWKGADSRFYFNGIIDDVRIYDRALSDDEILQLYQNNISAGKASYVSPSNGETDFNSKETELIWTAGSGATSHFVYFGTINPPPYQGEQTETTFDTGTMADGTTYYWHIDEKNAVGKATGNVWSFTTPYWTTAIPLGSETSYEMVTSDTTLGELSMLTFTSGSVIYVDANATGSKTGNSWVNAYNHLQDALNVATSGTQIWVARGTYVPSKLTVTGDSRSATFQLANGVQLYGGFSGNGNETSTNQRDWVKYKTILSGDLKGDDKGDFKNYGDNSYHVVTGSDVNNSAILDGFTIKSGGSTNDGAGMYNNGGSPTIRNCIFSGNLAGTTVSGTQRGGGMCNINSSPLITDCQFENNKSADYGGGIYDYNSSPLITDSKFLDNTSQGNGGGIYNDSSSKPSVTNCEFTGNTAQLSGAGMYNNNDGSNPAITNCIFNGNQAAGTATGSGGGGIYDYNSSPHITDCTFLNNTAKYLGGGIYNCSKSSPSLTTCEFTGNKVQKNGGGIYNDSSNPLITDCKFLQNEADAQGGGMYDINSSPLLTNCTFTKNTSAGSKSDGGGVYNYLNGSDPNFKNCIFNGNTAGRNGGGMYNSGDPILVNCVFACNAATVNGGGVYNTGDADPRVVNCTFTKNAAGSYAGGMYQYSKNCKPDINNCIFWGDTAVSGGNEIYNSSATPTFEHCDVNGCMAGGNWNTSFGTNGGGNIDVDPNFVHNASPEYDYYGDLRLQAAPPSPCIDKGGSGRLVPDTDILGKPRCDYPNVGTTNIDMGAYECQIATVPDVVTTPHTQAQAVSAITSSNLTPNVTYEYNSSTTAGNVITQYPTSGGSGIIYGTVNIVVAKAPDISFTLTDVGNGQVRIGYATNNGTKIRSVALTLSWNYAIFNGLTDVVKTDANFNCFMDYACLYPSPPYSLGQGNPLASVSNGNVCINMASFDTTGNQNAAPASVPNLVTLKLHRSSSGSARVTVNEDMLRSSFTKTGIVTNLPQAVTVTLP